jgi:hypothetical protein
MSSFANNATKAVSANQHDPDHKKKNAVPDTIVGTEGTAKRNILRKGGPGHARKAGVPKSGGIDDG